MSEHSYRTKARWTEARRGLAVAEGVAGNIEFASPPEFQGEPGFWTPEHFVCAAVASCFVTTFRAIADYSKFEYQALEVDVEGVLAKEEGGYRFMEVRVRPALTIAREEDRARGLRLLEKSERACLVSRSLNSEIKLEPQVFVAAGATK